jgi:hypothetical protein
MISQQRSAALDSGKNEEVLESVGSYCCKQIG